MWCTLVVSYRGHISHGNVDSILDMSQLIVLRTHKTRRLVITGCHWRGGEGWEGKGGEGRGGEGRGGEGRRGEGRRGEGRGGEGRGGKNETTRYVYIHVKLY